MKLRTRLLGTFLACGLIPLVIFGFVNYVTANRSMNRIQQHAVADVSEKSGEKLIALRDIKKAQIENYFNTIQDQILTFSEDVAIIDAMKAFRSAFGEFRNELGIDSEKVDELRSKLASYYTDKFADEYQSRNGQSIDARKLLTPLDDDSVALQYAYIRNNHHPLGSKHELDAAEDESKYSGLHAKYHPMIRSFLDKFGYYDIFLVDLESGDIVYSVFKELDYSTSLTDGPYANTNFGEAFRRARDAKNKDEIVLVDFKQYTPSYESPASFIASPIFDGEEKVGVAIFQMPVDRIKSVMNIRSGLGETGETYLVGPDHLMRTDTFRDPETHSIEGSFRNPQEASIHTFVVDEAIAGRTDLTETKNYLGEKVLCAYAPVDLPGLRWALIAEKSCA